MKLKRAVITGLGAITPIGNSVSEYWGSLIAGKSGAAPITHFDSSGFKTQFACEVKNFDPFLVLNKKETRKLDWFSQYALVATNEALSDSALNLEKINKDKAGVIWSSGIGGFNSFLEEVSNYTSGDGSPRFNPFFIPKMIPDIAAGHISIKYGFRGPNYATVSACASSTHALIDALNYIRLGKAEVFIVGGSEAAVNPAGIGGFNAMHALSTRNNNPQQASRPFDEERDGFVLGEGGAALVVEEHEHAIKRGAKIYCELSGGGMSADAYHITAPHPEGIGAINVMKSTIADAGISKQEIDYINVHGTSTPLGDISEIKAIQAVFKEQAYNINISSTKSMTGHLLGAAGAIEAVATILTIKNNIIPPTINLKKTDAKIDAKLNLTPNKAQKKDIKVAISNTFGFGGHNASVLFKQI